MLRHELLLKPNTTELSSREKQWIEVAKTKLEIDPYFSKTKEPLVGFYLDRRKQKAYPVFEKENSRLFAIQHGPSKHSVTSWFVNKKDVYSTE